MPWKVGHRMDYPGPDGLVGRRDGWTDGRGHIHRKEPGPGMTSHWPLEARERTRNPMAPAQVQAWLGTVATPPRATWANVAAGQKAKRPSDMWAVPEHKELTGPKQDPVVWFPGVDYDPAGPFRGNLSKRIKYLPHQRTFGKPARLGRIQL
jgi:hypothetical protein